MKGFGGDDDQSDPFLNPFSPLSPTYDNMFPDSEDEADHSTGPVVFFDEPMIPEEPASFISAAPEPLDEDGIPNENVHRHVSRKGTIAMIHRVDEIRPGVHELRMMICETSDSGKQRFFRAVTVEKDAIYLSERARTGDSIQLDGVVTTTPWGEDWIDKGADDIKISRAAVLVCNFQLTWAA